MRPERAFVAERLLANHCAELFRAEPTPGELLPALGVCGNALARTMAVEMADILGLVPTITCDAPVEMGGEERIARTDPVAANSLFCSAPDQKICVSLDARVVYRLVDKAFGGKGEAPLPLPKAFPHSAELMIARLEKAVGAALARAFELPAPLPASERAASLAELAPYPPDERLAVLALNIEESGADSWQVTVSMPLCSLPDLLGNNGRKAPTRRVTPGQRHPADEPFGAMPLTLSAVLVDMAMQVSTLASLHAGQVLPVAVTRSIPLKIGDQTIAHGTLGALDDRIAVQLTQVF